jgi:hypothetical protein
MCITCSAFLTYYVCFLRLFSNAADVMFTPRSKLFASLPFRKKKSEENGYKTESNHVSCDLNSIILNRKLEIYDIRKRGVLFFLTNITTCFSLAPFSYTRVCSSASYHTAYRRVHESFCSHHALFVMRCRLQLSCKNETSRTCNETFRLMKVLIRWMPKGRNWMSNKRCLIFAEDIPLCYETESKQIVSSFSQTQQNDLVLFLPGLHVAANFCEWWPDDGQLTKTRC